ncbi:MAG: tail fiber domain-containing protein, partial [bacterium]|nr:tail fiber domain-containing protein [bacterium]
LGLETVMQLNPVTYRVKQNGETTLGCIAEDVEAVNPILATYDANGQLTGVKMPQLTAVLTKAVQEQQLQIVNHESRIMNQDTLLSTITLKLDDNATTVDGLKTSMNSQLSIIGSSVNGLEIKLSSVIGHQSSTDSQISDLTVQTQHLASLQATIQTQMTDIKTQNQAILDFFTVLNPETLVTKDALGNVDLLKGKLEADGIVARAFTVKVVDQEAKTIGEAKIVPVKDIEDADNDGFDDKTNSKGGEIVVVKTKAVSDSAKIFVTSETGNPVIWSISKKKNGESFTIKLSEPTSEEVKFNWWIVEMKE